MPAVVEQYVRSVMSLIPRVYPDRERIEQDLRSHLADRVAAGATEQVAVDQMGSAADVAREFVRDMPLEYASPWRRALAYILDHVVLLGSAAVLLLPFMAWAMWNCQVDWTMTSAAWVSECRLGNFLSVLSLIGIASFGFVFLALAFFYFPLMEAYRGQTIGKWVLGLCVVDETGLRIGFGKALLRRIPSYLQFFWVDAIFAFFTKARQRAFDIVAHTVVIRCRSVGPAPSPTTRQSRQ